MKDSIHFLDMAATRAANAWSFHVTNKCCTIFNIIVCYFFIIILQQMAEKEWRGRGWGVCVQREKSGHILDIMLWQSHDIDGHITSSYSNACVLALVPVPAWKVYYYRFNSSWNSIYCGQNIMNCHAHKNVLLSRVLSQWANKNVKKTQI